MFFEVIEVASIKPYQSKGKTLYRVQVYAGVDPATGKKRYRSRQGIESERKAKMVANKLEYMVHQGKNIAKPKLVTFGELSKEYWKTYEGTVRQTTAETVHRLVRLYVSPELDKYRANLITPVLLSRVARKWAEKTPSVVKRSINYVQEVYKYGKKVGLVTTDPTLLMDRPKVVKKKPDDQFQYWDRDQIAKFFSCLKPEQNRADLEKFVLFKVLFMGGLRRGESVALTWADVEFKESPEVDVNINKTKIHNGSINPPKTQASYRIVPILDVDLYNAWRRWRTAQQAELAVLGRDVLSDEQQYVFTKLNGEPLSTQMPNIWLHDIINTNKLTPAITVHKTRHSFISNMLLAGVPVPTVQRLAGHSRPDVTLAVYAHISKDSKIDAAQQLSRYLKEPKSDSEKDSGQHLQ